MILSLFSLGPELNSAVKESQTAIENAFAQVLDEKYSFKNFTNEKVFMSEISTAVATDSIIVAATEPTYYKAFKNFISNSFKLKTKPSKEIVNLIESTHPEFQDDFIEEQANIPTDATPLLTQDGLYSGFGIKAKKQLLIVVPLDDKRIDYLINNSLLQFVRNNMDLSVLTADPLSGMVEEDSPLASRNVKNNGELFDKQSIKTAVKMLKSHNLSVAVANTKIVDFLSNISTTSVDLSDVIFLSSYNVEKGDMTARDYAINLAKGAFETSSNDIGAAITKVFSLPDEEGNQQFFMYACIADKENANVAKLAAEPGETPPELIYRAIEELFRMLKTYADTGYAVPQYSDTAVVNPRVAKRVNKELKKIKIAVASLIGASAIVSTILSLVLNNVYGVM